jgi:hypothetical protein
MKRKEDQMKIIKEEMKKRKEQLKKIEKEMKKIEEEMKEEEIKRKLQKKLEESIKNTINKNILINEDNKDRYKKNIFSDIFYNNTNIRFYNFGNTCYINSFLQILIHYTLKHKFDKLNEIINDEDCEFKYETIISNLFFFYESEILICNNKIINTFYYGDVDNQLSFKLKNKCFQTLNLIDMMKNKYLNGKKKLIKLPKILMITLLRAIIEEPLIKEKVQIDKEINLKDYLDKDFGEYSLCTEYSLYALNICFGKYLLF